MEIDLRDVGHVVEGEFAKRYQNFAALQNDEKYTVHWQKCIEAASDAEFLKNIIFCNDVFDIPPVKTFLTYFYLKGKFSHTFVKSLANDPFARRSLGAFWGAVFKSALGYQRSESVAVSLKIFEIKTASIFKGRD